MTSRTSRDGCVLSVCSIFIKIASLWKTLQAKHLFYLMYVCVFIYRNDSLLMTIYKYEKKIIRLDALVSMRDISVRAPPPPPPPPRHVVSILLGEKHILIHCLVKCEPKYRFFFSNVSFGQISPLKDNHDVI